MSETGLARYGEVVILTGPALRLVFECAVITVKHRKMTAGLPFSTKPYEALACELAAAMSAAGHPDVRLPAVTHPVRMEPTVPSDEVAKRLNLSQRQARRLAPQLGGKKIGRRWLVDETALREHIEGRQ